MFVLLYTKGVIGSLLSSLERWTQALELTKMTTRPFTRIDTYRQLLVVLHNGNFHYGVLPPLHKLQLGIRANRIENRCSRSVKTVSCR
jgi:hypothetical protein